MSARWRSAEAVDLRGEVRPSTRRSIMRRDIVRNRPPLVLVCAALLVLTACEVRVLTYDASDHSASVTAVLTPDGTDGYAIAVSDGAMHTAALDGNSGGNLRMVFWPADGPSVEDSATCAEWSAASPGTQQGAALRITSSGGVTRAITVTKNIWLGAGWIFDVHTWDSSAPADKGYTSIGQVSLEDELVQNQVLAPYPWHLCARVLGDQLSFKVWLSDEKEPAWGDPLHGGSVRVPADYLQPGYAGWYIGHVPVGGTADYTDLSAYEYVDDTTTSTTSTTSTTQPTTSTTSTTSTTQPATSTTTTQPDSSTTTTQPDSSTTTTSPPGTSVERTVGSVTVSNPEPAGPP